MKATNEILEFLRRQGARGGKQRARNLTPEQRSESARKAVQARWAKAKAEQEGQQKSKRGGNQ